LEVQKSKTPWDSRGQEESRRIEELLKEKKKLRLL